MKRKIFIKIGEDARSISPKAAQWAGMQYEDRATEVVFDISALEFSNALYRIDLCSDAAGYHPGKNLTPDGEGCISRELPRYITQVGGEASATAVITPLDASGEAAGEVLSYPLTLYFTEVLRNEEGEEETIACISEAAEAVNAMKGEVESNTEEVRRMYDGLCEAGVTAEELKAVRDSAEEVTETLHNMLESGELGGVGEETAEGGEIFGDYENNRAISFGASAAGVRTFSGGKAFKILAILPADEAKNYRVTVRGDVTEGRDPYEVGDVLQITANVNFNNSYKIASIDISGHTSILGIERTDSRSVQTMSLAEEHPNNTENWLYVAGKDNGEETPWLVGAAAFGQNVTVTGEAAFGAGFANTVSGDFAAGFGRGNKAGYAGLVGGALNEVGDYGLAAGNGNLATGINAVATGVSTSATKYASRAGGSGTVARNEYATAEGLGTKTYKQAQFVVGKYNKSRNTTLFEVGNGGSDSERSNAFEVYENGSVAIGGVTLTPEQLTRLLALITE